MNIEDVEKLLEGSLTPLAEGIRDIKAEVASVKSEQASLKSTIADLKPKGDEGEGDGTDDKVTADDGDDKGDDKGDDTGGKVTADDAGESDEKVEKLAASMKALDDKLTKIMSGNFTPTSVPGGGPKPPAPEGDRDQKLAAALATGKTKWEALNEVSNYGE